MGNEGVSTATAAKSDKIPASPKDQPPIYPYPDWAAMQAYYGGPGMMPPYHAPHPYMWGPQAMMPPFGTPYAVYPHGHPSMPFVGHPVSTASEKENNKNVANKQKEVNGLALSENSVKSSEVNSAEGSDAGTNNSNKGNGLQKRKKSSDGERPFSENKPNNKKAKGETSGTSSSKATSAGVGEITVKPLTTLAPPPPYCSPPINNGSVSAPLSHSGVSDLWFKDEREMKREKRKQSNRESARRSRLRKQAETEELAVKVESLTSQNNTLHSEINRLTEDADKLKLENAALLERLAKARSLKAVIEGQATTIQPDAVVENFLSMIDKQKDRSANLDTNIETETIDSANDNNNDNNNNNNNGGGGSKIHQLLDPTVVAN